MVRMLFITEILILFLTGCASADNDEFDYDYSASIACLAKPLDPMYGGGMLSDPTFLTGSDGWTRFGNANIVLRSSNETTNKFLVAYNRVQPFDSFGHLFHVEEQYFYTFSAWLQINKGKSIVSAIIKTQDARTIIVGSVIAKSGCWSMLKGGFQIDYDMDAQLYFQNVNNTDVELWLDNVSLKPFTKKQWSDQQNKIIEEKRKKIIRIHVTDSLGKNIKGAQITLNVTEPRFHIGCSSTERIIDTKAYQDWFVPRFTVTTFNNEMKWYYTEKIQGQENYTVPDAMFNFFQKNNISIRGHNILWDNSLVSPYWLKHLNNSEFKKAVAQRMGSVVSRYGGKVIAWDVINENMHYDFFERKIGPNASAAFFQITRALDPQTPLYLNEYNTLEYPRDFAVMPYSYVEKIKEIRSLQGNGNMQVGIGIQGHFPQRPNVSHVRAGLDVLGATKMPIWFTELDTKRGPDQVIWLEDIMREAFSHPAVEGIIVWGGWKPTSCNETCITDTNYNILPIGCSVLCLTDNNFNNLSAGDVVDKLIKEWTTTNLKGVTDEHGVFESNLFQGVYSLTVNHQYGILMKEINVIDEATRPLEISVSM